MKTGNIWEDFQWTVASDYSWRETPVGLVLGIADGARTTHRYRPLARAAAGLFREFAQLEPTPDAILGFARRYGSLGAPVQRMPGPDGGWRIDPEGFAPSGIADAGFETLGGKKNLVEPLECDPMPGEPIAWSWKSQIRLMAEFMRWLQGGSSSDVAAVLTREAVEELDTMNYGLQVNFALAATVAPRLTPTGRGRSFRFRFEPRSLLGAMWLQAAQAAAEGMTFRKCAACGRPIAIARTTGARSDAKFCSDACKSRSYRNRQARAVELADRGWAPGRIARELDTTTTAVRRWLK